MQFHWLNKQNNSKLIVFFAGWSFDYRPFEFLKCGNYDVLCIYDYNEISELPRLENYSTKYLISWSMGVFIAYKLRNSLPAFDKKTAINGTVYPVDDEFGIPKKVFLLTLRSAKAGLEGKFYQNVFDETGEYEKYCKNPAERSIENQVSELNNLYGLIKETDEKYEKYYDNAIISLRDKIIPAKNQIKFWDDFDTLYKTVESGHFPYYNYKCWEDLL